MTALRSEDVALFLVEPVQGKGIHLPPEGYLEGAQELCRRYGTLFCVDEVMTGFGRTGRMFAFQHWGLEPDLVTVAKTLSGGYVPSGALLMARSVHEAVFDSMPHAMSHGSTFAPNELAMAAGLATLHELREQRLVEQSARLGERLLELTRPLVDEFEVVQGVRGLGLAWAIEFGEPQGGGRMTYRMIERAQRGLFAQLVVVPLFTQAPDPEPGRRPRHGRDPNPAAARGDRRRRRGVRRRPARDDQGRAADAEVADEVRAFGRRRSRFTPLAALERQAAPGPLAPRAGIETSLATREPGPMEGDAGRDTRTAVRDELTVGELRQRLVPGCVRSAGDPPRRVVDLVRLAAPAVCGAGVDEREGRVGEPARDFLRGDRVAAPLARHELGRLDLLLSGSPLASPHPDPAEQDRAVVVTEVAKQPPEPLGAAAASVDDDVDAFTDAGAARSGGEPLRRGQRMPARMPHREIREVGVDVEERGARNVAGEIELAAACGVPELPPAVDEPVPHVPTTLERRSSRTTSRQTPADSPIPSRTPIWRNPQAL